MKTRVFLDTNFLMIPYRERIDIFQEVCRLMASEPEYELCVLDGTGRELTGLKERGKGEDKIAANTGLELIRAKNVAVVAGEPGLSVDGSLISLAEKDKGIIVCTNDKALRSQLSRRGIKVISMRGKDHLQFS